MRGVELGEFLRSRRRRVNPSDVGFPSTDRRRAPGLRREELSSVAGVAVSWLAKLEQGRAHAVSPDVLDALAHALRLDTAERAHLFTLAGFHVAHPHPPAPRVTPALRTLLDALEPNPAYLLDRAWNIIAWNSAEADLFPDLLAHEGTANLLELVFGDPNLARLMVDHDAECVRLVAQLRPHHAAWPDDPELGHVIERLQASSPRFVELWAAHDVAPFVTTRRVFDHPRLGRVHFDHHRLAVLDQVGAQLVVYTPVPA
ncbi:MAG: helix-turn-helix transcriptional regulator [Actinobacteria bacterium]|nr:helix-turn-helix transcriptional regulator [Actinomycetota bacterium]